MTQMSATYTPAVCKATNQAIREQVKLDQGIQDLVYMQDRVLRRDRRGALRQS